MKYRLDYANQGLLAGEYTREDGRPVRFTADWRLLLIQSAWYKGCNFEDLADGYGKGMGTHGDWSGIRDSSEEAILKMTERALSLLVKL